MIFTRMWAYAAFSKASTGVSCARTEVSATAPKVVLRAVVEGTMIQRPGSK
jgi:hypothetical protein